MSVLVSLAILSMILLPLVSADFFSNFWGKITGKATSDNTNLNISIGNSPPTVPYVQAISAQDPTIGSTTSIVFNFTATDTDGVSNIDNSTAAGYFNRTGEPTRSNSSCEARNASGNSVTFTCTIDMWYFDENGAWTINATIQDYSSALGRNDTTSFTYNIQTAMTMNQTSLTWPSVGVADTDTGSNNDPIKVNNRGNDVDLSINVTSYDLEGDEIKTDYIYANNFTIEDTSEGCSGTTMTNASSINVTSAILQRGNNTLDFDNETSGQELIHFCLKGVLPTISSQSYSSSAFGAWTVAIVSA